ncbi:MAG TPA: ChbG/HpnK family deacetylase [Bryobacteraceae bacterium]
MKRLIVNADDFGFTKDVNAGIVEAHRNGVLTSATLMANGEAFDDAVRLAREVPSLDIGCHLVLVQGASLLTGKMLPRGPRQLLIGLARRGLDVYSELRVQIEKIKAAGIRPSHLDTHKHTHLVPRVFRIVVRLASEFGVPYVRLPLDRTLRIPARVERAYRTMAERERVSLTDHFLGFRLTGSFGEKTFAAALTRLPDGLTEFMCHPGKLGPDLKRAETRLKESRVRELEALTSPRIRQLIDERQIQLARFDRQPGRS